MIKPIQDAYNKLKGFANKIMSAFNNMKIRIPKPKLPHINVSRGSTTIAGVVVPYPKFSVSWYAKGGLFDGPSVIGVGEAGPEAVVPLSGRRMEPFAKEIAKQMANKKTEKGLTVVIQQLIIQNSNNMRDDVRRLVEVIREEMNKQDVAKIRAGGVRFVNQI
jgi:hypothetical protein